MLKDKELLDMALKLKEHCNNSCCSTCIFRNSYIKDHCVLGDENPFRWELDVIIKENAND